MKKIITGTTISTLVILSLHTQVFCMKKQTAKRKIDKTLPLNNIFIERYGNNTSKITKNTIKKGFLKKSKPIYSILVNYKIKKAEEVNALKHILKLKTKSGKSLLLHTKAEKIWETDNVIMNPNGNCFYDIKTKTLKDSRTDDIIYKPETLKNETLNICFSPDGHYLFMEKLSQDTYQLFTNTPTIFDIKNHKEKKILLQKRSEIKLLPHGYFLYQIEGFGFFLIDLDTDTTTDIDYYRLTPNKQYLFLKKQKQDIYQLINLKTNIILEFANLKHRWQDDQIRFSPDNTWAFIWGENNMVLLDLETFEPLMKYAYNALDYTYNTNKTRLFFKPKEKMLGVLFDFKKGKRYKIDNVESFSAIENSEFFEIKIKENSTPKLY